MKKMDFSKAKALIFDSVLERAKHTRSMVRLLGFDEVAVTTNIDELMESAAGERLDLLIAEAVDRHTASIVTELRTGLIGTNPFCVVVMTLSSAERELIMTQMDCGADDILLRPFGEEDIKKRIDRLVKERRPFVVSGGYVGPCRREHEREGAEVASFQAPNTLKDISTKGEAAMEATMAWLDTARAKLTKDRTRLLIIRLSASAKMALQEAPSARGRMLREINDGYSELSRQLADAPPDVRAMLRVYRQSIDKLSPQAEDKAWQLTSELALGVLATWRGELSNVETNPEVRKLMDEVTRALAKAG